MVIQLLVGSDMSSTLVLLYQ